jgi:hypothetical protein
MAPSVKHLRGKPVASSDPDDQNFVRTAPNGGLAGFVGLSYPLVRREGDVSSGRPVRPIALRVSIAQGTHNTPDNGSTIEVS